MRARSARRGAISGARNCPVYECGLRTQLLWGARRDDFTAAVAALGSKVDHPIGSFDDVQIVLDDHHGVAVVAQRCSTPSNCSMS